MTTYACALHGQLNSLYFSTTKELTNHEVLTACAYVLMLYAYVASEN